MQVGSSVNLGQHLKSFVRPEDMPTFVYDKSELARTVTDVCFRPGGYCNVKIASGDWDDSPVNYYFRHQLNQVTEGANNGTQQAVQVHSRPQTMAAKLYALFHEPHFHYIEFTNRADSRQYEKVYSFQLLH